MYLVFFEDTANDNNTDNNIIDITSFIIYEIFANVFRVALTVSKIDADVTLIERQRQQQHQQQKQQQPAP